MGAWMVVVVAAVALLLGAAFVRSVLSACERVVLQVTDEPLTPWRPAGECDEVDDAVTPLAGAA